MLIAVIAIAFVVIGAVVFVQLAFRLPPRPGQSPDQRPEGVWNLFWWVRARVDELLSGKAVKDARLKAFEQEAALCAARDSLEGLRLKMESNSRKIRMFGSCLALVLGLLGLLIVANLHGLTVQEVFAGQGQDKSEAASPAEPSTVPVDPEPDEQADGGGERSPDSIMAQAEALMTAEKPGQALKLFDEAIKKLPGSSRAFAGRGFCLVDLGRNKEAIRALERAVKLDPRNGAAIITLADAYKFAGRAEDAREFYHRYLEVLPNGPEASVAKTNLGKPQ